MRSHVVCCRRILVGRTARPSRRGGVEPSAKRGDVPDPVRRAARPPAFPRDCLRCSTRCGARRRHRACPVVGVGERERHGETVPDLPWVRGPGGGTGRRRGLKPLGSRWERAGSIPAPGTSPDAGTFDGVTTRRRGCMGAIAVIVGLVAGMSACSDDGRAGRHGVGLGSAAVHAAGLAPAVEALGRVPDMSHARGLPTRDGHNAGWGVWSPDGTRIAFNADYDDPDLTDRTAIWNIYTMKADGMTSRSSPSRSASRVTRATRRTASSSRSTRPNPAARASGSCTPTTERRAPRVRDAGRLRTGLLPRFSSTATKATPQAARRLRASTGDCGS